MSYYVPGLTLVGVGGNDAGLAAKLAACAMPGTCSWAGDPQKRAATADEIGRLETKLQALYTELRELHPGGELYVVGYPSIINDGADASCDPATGIMYSLEERKYINASIRLLNQTLLRAADAAGVPFIDLYGALDGERLCDPQPQAVNGLRFGTEIGPIKTVPMFNIIGSESFHPTPRGHERIADAIRTRLAQMFGGEVGDLYDPDEYWEGLPPLDAAYHYEALVPSQSYQSGDELVISVEAIDARMSGAYRISLAGDELSAGTVEEYGAIRGPITLPTTIDSGVYELDVEVQTVTGQSIVLYDLVTIVDAPVASAEQAEPVDGHTDASVDTLSSFASFLAASVVHENGQATAAVLGATAVEVAPASSSRDQRVSPRGAFTGGIILAGSIGIGFLGILGAYLLVKRSRNRGG
ncbi:GDSL-type esterase/lipase family protein [Candidatus Saccharibacteria bacterium]|nr:GDSL-type esterase/lipase family protein [Candidatus Saccharibacteria bacterium]